MKQRLFYILPAVAAVVCMAAAVRKNDLVQRSFKQAEQQTRVMLSSITEALKSSTAKGPVVAPRTLHNDALVLVPTRDWTSGFFAGELWYLYEYSKAAEWKEQARSFTAKLEGEKLNGRTHDMGFKLYCSYGNGYRLTKDAAYKDILVQAARTLSTRFKPAAGIIRSWDHNADKWQCPVIIDNMMNLELLFFATRVTGDSSFYKIAVSHARTTMKNHFRPDYSSYHVVDYDTITGTVLKKNTHQGYSHESAWARGQAWGLYGYAMCYRETRDPAFLEQSRHIADYIFKHPNLPADHVPFWDFNAPAIPSEPRDVSAAAVIASGLYELSTFVADKREAKDLRSKADGMLETLATRYASPVGQNKGFLLLHSTGSKPMQSEVDVPLVYADYYYLEALLRKQALDKKNAE